MFQDDSREKELVRIFNLTWMPDHQRDGVDALLELTVDGRNYRFDVEVKSTMSDSVSTARDVGMDHIRKWRNKFFVIGFYQKSYRGPVLGNCLCLTPADMNEWISQVEARIVPDYKLASLSAVHLTLDDLYQVCGRKEAYSIEDAKLLHKLQWSASAYIDAADIRIMGYPAYSPQRMLEVLRLRLRYIAERGSTLNNPHIPATYLRKFIATNRCISDSTWAARIRIIADEFVKANPTYAMGMSLPDPLP